MGSKTSRVVRPHVKANASVAVTTSDRHDIDTRVRQDPAPQSTVCFSAEVSNQQQLMTSFEQLLVERQMMAIEYDAEPALPQPARAQRPRRPIPEPVRQCLICCKEISKDDDKDAVYPCRRCKSAYCTSCIKNTFIDACKDTSRMPPSCCEPINLSHAKPYLTQEEATHFREKYEEWCTPNPMYCPVPSCSAFIPDRLLPQNVKTKYKQRADSGMGTPNADSFACHKCEASICTECRQEAHPGSMCTIHEFGLDAETAKLLESWGYKKCPKCGHGLKRMFGCNHMECRCGAQFCWGCMGNINECDGGCYDGDEEEYAEDDDVGSDTDVQSDQNTATGPDTAEGATLAVPAVQASPVNLDGGGSNFWANSTFDFGEEPINNGGEPQWLCNHYFGTYNTPFSMAFTPRATDMECVKCWNTIHPTIEPPKASGNVKEKKVPTDGSRAYTNGVRRYRGRATGRGGGRLPFVPPRGLFRTDTTIGTAPHLTANLSLMSQSLPAQESSPMEDIQPNERILDTHGNIHTAFPAQLRHRASVGTPNYHEHKQRDVKFSNISSIFEAAPPNSSLAHECRYCYMLVCEKCKNEEVAKREEIEKRAREERENEAQRRQAEQREQETNQRDAVQQEPDQPAAVHQPDTAQTGDA
ncbi:hypothetical protein BDU57DRAFT_490948 [Ampelomyces quisqualis]|uniref:RBR-type E3 ubiquitin transferase n=1 Tax=Ampelomyces quisqualis TaxID=50730 RepID=A0A6A5QUA1_AMPQU|nr:hypothetical protein BDU57DRAFT_490948 [Ampelomyces quisqualis]